MWLNERLHVHQTRQSTGGLVPLTREASHPWTVHPRCRVETGSRRQVPCTLCDVDRPVDSGVSSTAIGRFGFSVEDSGKTAPRWYNYRVWVGMEAHLEWQLPWQQSPPYTPIARISPRSSL